ncbi:MAG: choice-of-anchor B family protein, partial [Planctomycetes bacterium]|nr:choice-of-anchor B family protein [Planctomycetota bacterium]
MALTQAAHRKVVRPALVLGLLLAPGAAAADPDLRKLQEREPPAFGEIWRLGDPTPRSGGFDAQGVTLLSHIPLNQFTGVARAMGNDCWGYTAPSGREYAIMGLEGGFGYVEITDPTNPQILATIPGPSSVWRDVKVVGHYAYGVSEGGSGIQVMDLSNIDNGQVTLVRNWTSGGYSTTHNIIAGDDDGSLWICGANIGNGGLINIDITNPTLPALNGGWTQMYVHDAQVVVWDRGDLAGRRLAFCAAGFNFGFSETGLRIVDVTNPSSPQVISTVFYPGARYAHQVWLSEDRRYLYLNDELDVGDTSETTTTRIFNVDDPANAFYVGTFTSGLPAVAHNLYTRDGLIFQANYRSGLRVFDKLDPENPVEIAYLDTYPGTIAPEFNGAWSNYPFFPSGTVIVSDIERGLFVARVDAEPRAVAIRALGTPPALVPPAGGAELTAAVFVRSESNPVVSVDLMVDAGSGFQPAPAFLDADGHWTAQTPPAACDTTVRAYFRAEVADGRTAVYPAGAPDQALEFTVADAAVEVFADDFSTDQGWTVGAPDDD